MKKTLLFFCLDKSFGASGPFINCPTVTLMQINVLQTRVKEYPEKTKKSEMMSKGFAIRNFVIHTLMPFICSALENFITRVLSLCRRRSFFNKPSLLLPWDSFVFGVCAVIFLALNPIQSD